MERPTESLFSSLPSHESPHGAGSARDKVKTRLDRDTDLSPKTQGFVSISSS